VSGPEDIFTIFSLLLGGCVGSFLNVCVFRIPRPGLSVWRPRGSFCPACETPIRATDNVPVLAWVLLRGRCRACGVRIPIRYPLIELLTALMFLALWFGFGPSGLEELAQPAAWVPVLFWWAVFSTLLVISVIDIDLQIIPDELSVTGGALALLVVPFVPGVPHDLWLVEPIFNAAAGDRVGVAPDTPLLIVLPGALLLGAGGMFLMRRFNRDYEGRVRSWWETRWAGAVGLVVGALVGLAIAAPARLGAPEARAAVAALLGAGIGAGTIYGIGRIGSMIARKEAMGFGDVKLLGLLGALVGAKFVLFTIFLASFLGSVIGLGIRSVTRSSTIPFGPFLCAGAVILIVAGARVDSAIEWYLRLLQP
jgi:leader peptidase (prepilin peptidase)/N-methyltransferase